LSGQVARCWLDTGEYPEWLARITAPAWQRRKFCHIAGVHSFYGQGR